SRLPPAVPAAHCTLSLHDALPISRAAAPPTSAKTSRNAVGLPVSPASAMSAARNPSWEAAAAHALRTVAPWVALTNGPVIDIEAAPSTVRANASAGRRRAAPTAAAAPIGDNDA